MKMYYCTRYEHNPVYQTEYYTGNGYWDSESRTILFFKHESDAKHLVKYITEADWHEVEIDGIADVIPGETS